MGRPSRRRRTVSGATSAAAARASRVRGARGDMGVMLTNVDRSIKRQHRGPPGRRGAREGCAAEEKGPELTQPWFCDATASSSKAGYEPAAGPVGPQPTEPHARPSAGPSMGLCPIPGRERPSRGEQGGEATKGYSGVMRARVVRALAAGNPRRPREGSHGGGVPAVDAAPWLPLPRRLRGAAGALPGAGRGARDIRPDKGPGPLDVGKRHR